MSDSVIVEISIKRCVLEVTGLIRILQLYQIDCSRTFITHIILLLTD